MKLALVTTYFPWALTEAFLGPELETLATMGVAVNIFPLRRFRGAARPGPFTADAGFGFPLGAVAWGSTGTYRSAARLVVGGGSLRAIAVNAFAVAAGVALGRKLRREGYTHVHAYWASGAASLGMIAAEEAGLSWSFTGHRWDLTNDFSLAVKLRSACRVRLISKATRLLARENLVQSGLSMQDADCLLDSKAEVANLGIHLPAEAPGPGSTQRFIHPANLLPVKGHVVLLAAMRRLVDIVPGAQLELAGDGPERSRIEAEVRRLGLQRNVEFLGMLPHRDLLARYQQRRYAGMVLPSLDLGNGSHEGKPVSLMEAMGYGIPVISTATGGIPELVVPGTGLLVAPGDAEALAEGMLHLLRHGRKAVEMGQLARGHITRYYDVRLTSEAFWGPILRATPESREIR